jgi:hypothetical protein
LPKNGSGVSLEKYGAGRRRDISGCASALRPLTRLKIQFPNCVDGIVSGMSAAGASPSLVLRHAKPSLPWHPGYAATTVFAGRHGQRGRCEVSRDPIAVGVHSLLSHRDTAGRVPTRQTAAQTTRARPTWESWPTPCFIAALRRSAASGWSRVAAPNPPVNSSSGW